MKRTGSIARLQTFARQYVSLQFNGKAAAIAAGYSPKSAEMIASRLLRKAKVRELVARFSAPIIKKEQITVERTLVELARLAYVDPGQLFDEKNKLRPINELPPDVRACIAGVDVGAKGKVSHVKIADKARALYMLCQCLKMFAEDRTPADMGVKIIVLDMPRPMRQVGAGAAALPPSNRHNGNGSGPHDE